MGGPKIAMLDGVRLAQVVAASFCLVFCYRLPGEVHPITPLARNVPSLVPDVTLSLFRLKLAQDWLSLAQVVGACCTCALFVNYKPQTCAAALWLLVVSENRVRFPLTDPVSETLAAALLWLVVLSPGRSEKRRATFPLVAAAAYFMARAWSTHTSPLSVMLALVIATSSILDAFASTGPHRTPWTLEARSVLAACLMCVGPIRSVLRDDLHASRALASIAWDLGLLETAPPEFAAPDAMMSWRESRKLLPVEPGLLSALSYLVAGRDRPQDGPRERLRLRAFVRQSVADAVCVTRPTAGLIDLVLSSKDKEALVSFRCVNSIGHLQPRLTLDADSRGEQLTADARRARKLAAEQRLGDFSADEGTVQAYIEDSLVLARMPPVRELILAARWRADAREFDEALSLLQMAERASRRSVIHAAVTDLLATVGAAAVRQQTIGGSVD